MAAKGETLEDWGCKRRPGVQLLTLAATLVAALAVAHPALADEGPDPAPAAAAEAAASEPAPAAAAPAPAAAPASQADGGPAGAPPVMLEAEEPVTLEPAEEAEPEPEAKPAETPAPEPAEDPAKPAETPASENPADNPSSEEPSETEPDEATPEQDPADAEPADCTSSGSSPDSASADASADAPDSGSTDASPACEAADDEEPETCASATPAGGSTEGTPATGATQAGATSAGCNTTVTVPVPPAAKPGVPLATPASSPAATSGTTVMVLVVTQAAEEPTESAWEETPSGSADADSPEQAPVAVLASPTSLLPTRQKPIRLEASRAEEEWLGAVRALSPSRTIPASVRRCVRPNGLVPLSRVCMTTRTSAGPLLAMRLKVWPSVPTSAAEFNEVAREIARARDRRPAREAKRSARPTLERATPVRRDQRGPWASGGSAGGSAAASATTRHFALTAMVAVPYSLPRVSRVAPRSSLVPTGELGISLPERPG